MALNAPPTELTEQQRRVIEKFMQEGEPYPTACGCMGALGDEPLCPCAMRWVIEDEGEYFRISKERVDLGYQYTAASIGPVGGPYLVDSYRRPIKIEPKKPREKMTRIEILREKFGERNGKS